MWTLVRNEVHVVHVTGFLAQLVPLDAEHASAPEPKGEACKGIQGSSALAGS